MSILLSDEQMCKLCGKMESGDCDENGPCECPSEDIEKGAKAQLKAVDESCYLRKSGEGWDCAFADAETESLALCLAADKYFEGGR